MAAQWSEAIEDWRTGDPSTLDKMLRGRCDIPDFARVFLADALAGKEVRPRGKPRAPRHGPLALLAREAMILMDYEWFHMVYSVVPGGKDGDGATKRAFTAVAKKWRYKVTPSAVSRIVYKRRGR
ncbi:MAG: hypothetical protein ACYC02_05935 [Thiobacillus sp.]